MRVMNLANVPAWVQVALVVIALVAGAFAAFIHVQDEVLHNREAIERVEMTVKDVDDIVRDNQQRLAHIEALLGDSRADGAAQGTGR